MATASVTFTNTFEDGETSKLVINNVQSTKLSALKSKVIAFNESIATSDYPTRMVSKTGAKWKRISNVEITVTDRTYLF